MRCLRGGPRRGWAARAHAFDVVIVIDTSRSTIEPAHGDIDGDGERRQGHARAGRLELRGALHGSRRHDPGGGAGRPRAPCCAVSIRATRASRWSPSRASLPKSSTGTPGTRARPHDPAAHRGFRPRRARARPGRQAASPRAARTWRRASIRRRSSCWAQTGAKSDANPRSEKLIFFFTDGQPTLPYGPREWRTTCAR